MSTRSRNYATVIYPESAPDNWQQLISDLHVEAFLSPLHDCDINPDGELKKPHYHLLLMFPTLKSEDQVSEIFSSIGGVGREIVQSVRGYSRYLTHRDNPEKHQYNEDEVISFGGADYFRCINLASDEDSAISEMIQWINQTETTLFCDLADYAIANRPDWYRVLRYKGAVFMREYCKSYAYKLRMRDIDSEYVKGYNNLDL